MWGNFSQTVAALWYLGATSGLPHVRNSEGCPIGVAGIAPAMTADLLLAKRA